MIRDLEARFRQQPGESLGARKAVLVLEERVRDLERELALAREGRGEGGLGQTQHSHACQVSFSVL